MRLLMDIESYWNFFCVTFKDYDTKEYHIFEISSRKNQFKELYFFMQGLKRRDYVITFNGIHYDSPILWWIYGNVSKLRDLTGEEICNKIKNVSDDIIKSDDFPSYLTRYKFHKRWTDIDSFVLLWSQGIRQEKGVSLKKIGIQLEYPVVMELPYHHTKLLEPYQMVKLIEYNSIHDIGIMEYLMDKPIYMQGKKTSFIEQVKMRQEANSKYGFGLHSLSWDGVKLGMNILLKSYSDYFGFDFNEIKKRTNTLRPIALQDIILTDIISFEEGDLSYKLIKKKGVIHEFTSFAGLYNWLLQQTVTSTDEINCQVWFNGLRYDVKSGGLHTVHKSGYVKPPQGQEYNDEDVGSYYPTLGSKYKFTPSQLEGMDMFLELFRQERLRDKREGRYGDDRLKKLALNGGFFGMLNQKHSPMYDPKQLLSITLNGQLLLLMLIERLSTIGCNIDSANTDGVSLFLPDNKIEQYNEVKSQWERETQMELEKDTFKFVARQNVNNYIAIKTDGSVKKKGIFVTTPDLGNSTDFLIIPMALEQWYLNNIPPEQFIPQYLIDNPIDGIFKFCGAVKVNRSYTVYWGDTIMQQLNRYYVSSHPDATFLYKKRESSTGSIMKGIRLMIYNNHLYTTPTDINIQWYISETRKIIEDISPQFKTTLF